MLTMTVPGSDSVLEFHKIIQSISHIPRVGKSCKEEICESEGYLILDISY